MSKDKRKVKQTQAELWQRFCVDRKHATKCDAALGRAVRKMQALEKEASEATRKMRATLYAFFKAHGLATDDISMLASLANDERFSLVSAINACNQGATTKAAR